MPTFADGPRPTVNERLGHGRTSDFPGADREDRSRHPPAGLTLRPARLSRSGSATLNGVTSFVAAFASPVWGRVADRRGRKLMLLRSSLAIGVFTALMGVAANVWQFFAFRALMGVFAGFSSAAIALVATQVPEGRLGYALGWLSTGQLVGSLVGPLIGGALADLTGSYRIPFYCTSATILLSLALVWFAVDERFVAPPKARGSHRSSAA